MSNLLVITFDNMEDAGKIHETLAKGGEHIHLNDSAVVVKDEDGKVHVKNEMDRGVKIGAVGGGFLGLLIAGVFFPVGGLILGALGGALVGKMLDVGIDSKFVKEVGEAIGPGMSALFIVVRDADPNYALAALRPYKGTVYQTSLPTEAEEEVRRVLSKKI